MKIINGGNGEGEGGEWHVVAFKMERGITADLCHLMFVSLNLLHIHVYLCLYSSSPFSFAFPLFISLSNPKPFVHYIPPSI